MTEYVTDRSVIMKNRRFAQIIALLLVVVICLTACSQKVEPDLQKTEPTVKNNVEEVMFERIWKHDEAQDRDIEYAIILGLDSAEEAVWSYITDEYPVSQVDLVEEVLITQTQYIFCEDGALKSLDISTGEILWENREFEGYSAWGVEADNGNLYFCSYLGTSFFAVDKDGKTLYKMESFGPEYSWAHDIRMEGDKIAVPLGLGPEELRGPDGFVMLVDPDDYSFALQNPEIPEAEPVVLPALAGDIAQVLPLDSGAVAVLYTDGTVGVAGNNELAAKAASWKNVAQLYYGTEEGTLLARMADGTAASTEYNLSGWRNLKELYVNYEGIAGLKEDGTIVAVGSWTNGSPDGWTEIRELYLSWNAWGLKMDGSLVCTDDTYYKELASQQNVRQLLFGHGIYAVLEDGGIFCEDFGETEFKQLKDAASLTVIDGWLFGLTADGQLLAQTRDGWVYNDGDSLTMEERPNEETNPNIYPEASRYQNIMALDYQNALIMLKYDGTVDTVNVACYWDLSDWNGIEKITVASIGDWGSPRIYGVRADGSVIVADADYQQESNNTDNYLGWRVVDLFYGDTPWYTSGVVGITAEGTLVGDGDYANTDFSVLIR